MNDVLSQLKRKISKIDVYFAGLLEPMALKARTSFTAPPLFILGLPRSGTTLVYQYIVHRLEVSYLTNGVGRYYLSPYLTTLLQTRLHGVYKSDFQSDYGKVSGPVAPREAGTFWSRFMDIDEYVTYDDLDPSDVELLPTIIASIQHIYGGAPFVNKNVKHLLRIDALSKIFPEARFLVVRRDLKDVALSVLRGRYKNMGDSRRWWSVKPPNFDSLENLAPHAQVAHQLVSLNKKLDHDLSALPAHRILSAAYHDFCANPEQLIGRLIESYRGIAYRNPAESSFSESNPAAKTDEEQLLLEELRKLTALQTS